MKPEEPQELMISTRPLLYADPLFPPKEIVIGCGIKFPNIAEIMMNE